MAELRKCFLRHGCMGLLGLAEHVHAQFQSPAPAQRPFAQPAVRRRARTCASPGNLGAVFVGARARSSSTPAGGAGQKSLLRELCTACFRRSCACIWDGRHRRDAAWHLLTVDVWPAV